MKTSNVKKVILLLLSLVLVYIWWGNIRTFYQSSDAYSGIRVDGRADTLTLESEAQLPYRGVKVNPFRRPTQTQDKTAKPPTRSLEEKPPPALSQVARLTGLVEKGQLSQAVVMTNDSQTFVLSLRDTLVYWWLDEVTPTLAVFRQGKYYDTLWLETMQR